MKEQLIKWLNLVLVANVFFVLFSFFWLVVAVLGNSFKLNLVWIYGINFGNLYLLQRLEF